MNVVSLLLGLASLVLAVHALRVRGCLICCTAGLSCCVLALVCQLIELYRLSCIGDTAAIYDTIYARVLAACVLAGLNILPQLLALLRRRGGCA